MFKQLFNWIKFKVLPPSVLFSNRLYLERGSKARRITTNLGLTFRNAKWLSYERVSVNVRMRKWFYFFLCTAASLLSILLLVVFFSTGYDFTASFNPLAYYLWLFKDFLAYQVFTLISFVSFQGAVLLEFLYVNWVGWLFIKTSTLKNDATLKKQTKPLSSQDSKYLFLAWLKDEVELPVVYYGQLFSTLPTTHGLFAHTDFKNLYSILPTLVTAHPTTSLTQVSTGYFLNSPNLVACELFLRNYSPKVGYGGTSLSFLRTKLNWACSLTEKNSPLKKGLFYKTNLTASSYSSLLFPKNKVYSQDEFFSINNVHFKTMRFLYNYSFLHRKVFQDSHKITLTKKLLSSGFYSNQLFKKNIWLSDILSNSESSRKLLKAELGLNYGSLFKSQLPTYSLLNANKLNSTNFTLKTLSFYESSFIWFIKRLEQLTILKTQKTLFSWNPRLVDPAYQTKSPLTFGGFTKSTTFLNFFLNYESPYSDQGSVFHHPSDLSSAGKGLKLSTFDFDLLTHEDENLLIEFIGNSSGQESTSSFWYSKPCFGPKTPAPLKGLPPVTRPHDERKNTAFAVYFLHKTFELDLINFFKVTA